MAIFSILPPRIAFCNSPSPPVLPDAWPGRPPGRIASGRLGPATAPSGPAPPLLSPEGGLFHIVSADEELYIVSADEGLHIISADEGIYIVSADDGLYIVSADDGLYIVSADAVLYIVSADDGLYIVSADDGYI